MVTKAAFISINNGVTIVILLQFEIHVPYFNIISIAIYISDSKY